jgi:hypothetical protein
MVTGQPPLCPFLLLCTEEVIMNNSEAFGTSECIPSSQCGNSPSIIMVIMGVVFALSYVLFKSSREETPSGVQLFPSMFKMLPSLSSHKHDAML